MSPPRTQTVRSDRQGSGQAGSPRPGVLALLSEGSIPGRGGVYPIGAEATVGRDVERQIFIEDPGLSRHHATLTVKGSEIWIRDEDSHNGTFVNGARVDSSSLRQGDVIRCGTSLLMAVRDTRPYSSCPPPERQGPLLGGPAMEAVRRRIDLIALRDVEVLITGESGTGKEVAARLIHQRSGREGAFVAVNCAALPESLFEAELFGARKGAFTGATGDQQGLMKAARHGTLFLDEIGDLPLPLQPKLLRAVELKEARPLGGDREEPLSLRFVAATHRDLSQEVEAGRFRQDLYYRLRGAVVQIKPLRERPEDITMFVLKALDAARHEQDAAPGALYLERVLLHAWPGNVRELNQTVEQSLLEARLDATTHLLPCHLPASALAPAADEGMLDQLRQALSDSRGNVAQAAADLNVSRSKIYELLKSHGLSARSFR